MEELIRARTKRHPVQRHKFDRLRPTLRLPSLPAPTPDTVQNGAQAVPPQAPPAAPEG
jgi:hypothetical protein